MDNKTIIMDENNISRAITRISHEIIEKNRNIDDLVIVGIRTRGIPLAKRIKNKITEIEKKEIEIYKLDPFYYRDDLNDKDVGDKKIKEFEHEITKKTVILVDDVLYTGRTVRAALEAIIDRGRPKKVQLVVLIDRGHRELPIRPDYIGKNLPTSQEEIVSVMFEEIDDINQVIISKK